MAEPITREALVELYQTLDRISFRYPTPSVAEEDEDGIVHLSDPDTGAPRMHMPREVFDQLRAWKPPLVWHKDDPRHTIYKRATIVIVRPRAPGIDRVQSCVASVETHHGYLIDTGFEKPYHFIGDGDDWPDEGWQWALAPEDLR